MGNEARQTEKELTMQNEKYAKYKPTEIPQALNRTLYIGYGIGKYNSGEVVISEYGFATGEDFGVVPLVEHELFIKIPKCKVDVKGRMLEVLEVKKQKVLAENHLRLQEVQEKIDSLLSIEYQPSEGA